MAKKARKIKSEQGLKLKIVNPNAAGIDVADGELQVCVPEERDGDNNRCFTSFTSDLRIIAEWLKACRIDTVAMEATGVYWVNVFFFLQDKGFDVILANPSQVKNYSGKKTDVADAEWLMLLHSYGLIKASYNPDSWARRVPHASKTQISPYNISLYRNDAHAKGYGANEHQTLDSHKRHSRSVRHRHNQCNT